jgi:hypothetical protein
MQTHCGAISANVWRTMKLFAGVSRRATVGALLLVSPIGAFAAYVADFESPMFQTGPINGQDSWTTPVAVEQTARMLTADEIALELSNTGRNPGIPVHGGMQALAVSGAGASSATIRQIGGLESDRFVQLDVWARPLTAGTTGAPIGNIFLTMEDSTGDRAAAFRFGFVGGVQTIDYGTAITGVWQASGLQWAEDTWYQLTMTVDYATKTYDFAVNGAKVNANPIPFYTALSDDFRQIRIFRGSNQAGMIVDDLSVQAVPEPTVAACLTLGVLGFAVRRRCSVAEQ